MFLSIVAADNARIGALTRDADRQRFNVAASRARDQMWLFHSVDLEDLNPDCMRYRLLNYCLEPGRPQREAEEVADRFESQFERDVFERIVARGYAVQPQVVVGQAGRRIDLVVEGLHSRLAVECDGDRWHGPERWEEDQARQAQLERIGWTFVRVRASAFYRDSENALKPVWLKLEEMKIEPGRRLDHRTGQVATNAQH
jgi:very-short-patch-repair endonuclease